MKHTYKKPIIQVARIDYGRIMDGYSRWIVNAKDTKEYEGPVIDNMNPSAGGSSDIQWDEKIWGQAD